jgi:hypothetical protein
MCVFLLAVLSSLSCFQLLLEFTALSGHVERIGEKRNAYRISVGKPEGKTPLGRPRSRWVDNIKMDLKRDRMGWYGLDSPGSEYEAVEGSCEYGNEPSGSIKCWEVLE